MNIGAWVHKLQNKILILYALAAPEWEEQLTSSWWQPYILQIYSIKGGHSGRQHLEETIVEEINEINLSIPLIGM